MHLPSLSKASSSSTSPLKKSSGRLKRAVPVSPGAMCGSVTSPCVMTVAFPSLSVSGLGHESTLYVILHSRRLVYVYSLVTIRFPLKCGVTKSGLICMGDHWARMA